MFFFINIWFRRRVVYLRVASTRRVDSERLIAVIGIYYVRHSHARCRRELCYIAIPVAVRAIQSNLHILHVIRNEATLLRMGRA